MKRLLQFLSRVGRELSQGKNIDAYFIALVTLVFSLVGFLDEKLIGNAQLEDVRWAAVLAGVGLLVLRATAPAAKERNLDLVLNDRVNLKAKTLEDRLKNARQLWVATATGVAFLQGENRRVITNTVLSRKNGDFRFIMQDPEHKDAMRILMIQLDEKNKNPDQGMETAMKTAHECLTDLKKRHPNEVQYGYTRYNPGFSMVLINPDYNDGVIIVEFYGYSRESNDTRMHIEIARAESDRWFLYWKNQFEDMWSDIRKPDQKPVQQAV
jgi:hypothetical protein